MLQVILTVIVLAIFIVNLVLETKNIYDALKTNKLLIVNRCIIITLEIVVLILNAIHGNNWFINLLIILTQLLAMVVNFITLWQHKKILIEKEQIEKYKYSNKQEIIV